jgi:hypothetical protein
MQEPGGMKMVKVAIEKLARSTASSWKLQSGHSAGLCIENELVSRVGESFGESHDVA